MIVLHFLLPAKPLTMNQRLHWAAKGKITREWRQAAFLAALDARGHDSNGLKAPQPRSTVQLVVPVKSLKVRRDPHNWYPTVKACVDGLVDAGLWPDDTAEYVATVEPAFKQGGDVELRIEAL